MKEKTYENKIKNYIKATGNYVVKYHGNKYSESGTPDLLACINGYFLALEIKADKGKPSELQKVKLRNIKKANGLGYIVYPKDWEKVKSIIDNLIKGIKEESEELYL